MRYILGDQCRAGRWPHRAASPAQHRSRNFGSRSRWARALASACARVTPPAPRARALRVRVGPHCPMLAWCPPGPQDPGLGSQASTVALLCHWHLALPGTVPTHSLGPGCPSVRDPETAQPAMCLASVSPECPSAVATEASRCPGSGGGVSWARLEWPFGAGGWSWGQTGWG